MIRATRRRRGRTGTESGPCRWLNPPVAGYTLNGLPIRLWKESAASSLRKYPSISEER
jgi:hypothetical protein